MSRRSSPSIRLGAYASPALKGALLAAGAATLSACEADNASGSWDTEESAAYAETLGSDQSARATAFASVDQCVSSGISREDCQSADADARKSAFEFAPRYASQPDCQQDYEQCEQANFAAIGNAGGSTPVWIPFFTGFLMSEVLDEVGDSFERKRKRYAPLYRTRDGSLVNGSGYGVPSYGTHTIGRSGHYGLTQPPSRPAVYSPGSSQTSTRGSVAGSRSATVSNFRSSASYSTYSSSSSSRSISRGGFGGGGRGGSIG
jgi:uncharacterized protein YgiB involved in biofilm formation